MEKRVQSSWLKWERLIPVYSRSQVEPEAGGSPIWHLGTFLCTSDLISKVRVYPLSVCNDCSSSNIGSAPEHSLCAFFQWQNNRTFQEELQRINGHKAYRVYAKRKMNKRIPLLHWCCSKTKITHSGLYCIHSRAVGTMRHTKAAASVRILRIFWTPLPFLFWNTNPL